MYYTKRASPLLLLSLLAAAPTTLPTFPPTSLDRSASTPDYCQTDPDGKLPGNGRSYCGPTSSSNALIYLANNGFPKLLPTATTEKQCQIELIKQLAAPGFMTTVDGEGTGPGDLMTGLKKFVETAGYKITRLEHQNWRTNSKAFPRVAELPSPDWIKAGLAEKNSAVLLNIGWYKYDAATQTYTRGGGHWITLVGYGVDKSGKQNTDVLIVHDPSPTAGQPFFTEYTLLTPLEGTLAVKSGENLRTHDAKGIYELKGDMKVKKGFDAGIIDGAVVMVLENPSKN